MDSNLVRGFFFYTLPPPPPTEIYEANAYLLEGQAEGINSGHQFKKNLRHRLDMAEEEQHRRRLGQSPEANVMDP